MSAAKASRPALSAAAPFAAAFVARVVAGLLVPAGRYGGYGFDFYGALADHLRAGDGFGWWFYDGLGWKLANRGPLYPLLLAGVRSVAGGASRAAELGVQAAIGAAAIALPAMIARRWGGDRAARAALWIAALWPYWVVADGGMVEHVLYAPLCTLAAWTWMSASDDGPRRGLAALRAGAVCGLATLARLTFLTSVPWLAVAGLRRLGAGRTALALAAVGIVLAPWVLRNHEAVGSWVVGTDGGRALLVGNHEATFVHYPDRSVDLGEREIFRRLGPERMAELRALGADEVAQDAEFRRMALREMRADPAATAGRMARKAAALWSPVYNPGPAGALKLAVFAATFLPLLAAACAGAATCPRMRADLLVVVALLASFTATAAVFWGQPRYLAPLHGLGIACAAAWVARRPDGLP